MKEHKRKFIESLPREMRQPTDLRLKAECAEVANVMQQLWDSEVDVVITMTRKRSNQAIWACSNMDRGRLLRLLAEIRDSSRYMDVLIHANKPEGKAE
jgi:hypothetical protein